MTDGTWMRMPTPYTQPLTPADRIYAEVDDGERALATERVYGAFVVATLRGLDAEGIYRVSGRHAAVQELQHKIERDEDAFEFHAPADDVYAVSSLLKVRKSCCFASACAEV